MNLKSLTYSCIVLVVVANAVMISCEGKGGKSGAAGLYETHCSRCHGMDGKKGYKGAEDLNESDISLAYRIEQIQYGEGQMPGFQKKLTEEEIASLAQYTIDTFGPKTPAE